jgi:hypothetical protein
VSEPKFVYFIQVGQSGPIKIGSSFNPAGRLASLQGGHHDELHLIGVAEGGEAAERELHTKLADFHISREWFEPAQPVLVEIGKRIHNFNAMLAAATGARDALQDAIGALRSYRIDDAEASVQVARERLETFAQCPAQSNAPAALPLERTAEASTTRG